MGKFVLMKITQLSNLCEGDSIPESDYLCQHQGFLYQFKYVDNKEKAAKLWARRLVNPKGK